MARATIRRLGEPGDLEWVVAAHGEIYADEFGWGPGFAELVARIVAEVATADDARRAGRRDAWVAELDGRRVGCVFCVPAGPGGGVPGHGGTAPDDGAVAQLRLLLVDPAARGEGLGGRLVDECLAFARAAGYLRMRLWTNHPLVAARSLYLARGFRLVAQDDRPHHDFGVPLLGQVYELDLTGAPL